MEPSENLMSCLAPLELHAVTDAMVGTAAKLFIFLVSCGMYYD
jgi:hypothetical protein